MVKYAIVAAVLVASVAVEPARSQTVMLCFSSPTCGPCQQMAPTIQSLQAAGYPIRKVDVTQEPGLAQQYSVTQVPCFVMLVDGREASRARGAVSGQQLQQMFPPEGRERSQSPDLRTSAPVARTAPPEAVAAAHDPWSGLEGGAPLNGGEDAPARYGAPEAAPTAQDAQLISCSVRLKVDDASGHSYGTGTIVDARSGQALIITCGHLFRDSKGQGPVTVELFEVTPQGVRVIEQVPGHIESYNVDREIGLVSIRPKSAVQVAPIAPTATVMARGDRVTSVGCNNGKDPTTHSTRVTATNRYQGPPNIEAQGAPVEGRSGGGLFNTAGELVGVCFAADYEGNEGLYTALESIYDEFDRLGLADVYQKSAPGPRQPAPHMVTATPPVVRGQEPMPPVMPVANDYAQPPGGVAMNVAPNGPAAAPAGLNQVEQAAWDEIMARAADSEVICIIRPKQPGGKSEVITLGGVSDEFVRGLAEQSGAVPTITR